ncbi:Ubiquitin [Gossypium australe]|uniref:ubiquitinyl hydrolase 1 n=1 Tax=Gossypium australe TaxID=47621 RepID=A0A5B6WDE1_9ROSI|nr:Ubiquitin [Gossypium australe]
MVLSGVSVKWQKEVFKSVEIDTSQPPYVFKCQLYDLTGVPPERQKIMVKGGLLKGDADWSTVGVKQVKTLDSIYWFLPSSLAVHSCLMNKWCLDPKCFAGSKIDDEIVKAPEKDPVFMEDLPEEEQVVSLGHSAGLFNLGNTCYMNSTVQCLHSVPELKSALFEYSHSGRSNDLDQTSHMLTVATRDLFNELDKSVKPVAPMQFWMVLLIKHPQFSQLHNGVFMQQNVGHNFYTPFLSLFDHLVPVQMFYSANVDIVKDLFGIELASRIHCQESGEESFETQSIYSLKCHISHEGLKSELEKASPALGHSAIYFKESQINGLPRYLTIQFVRFFWKRELNQKAKILRKVDYPLELDVYDLCSDELHKRLEGPRQLLRDDEVKKLALKANEKSSGSKDGDVKMTDAEESSNAGGESSATTSQEAVPSDKETSLTGIYGLVAVLTHKGRSAVKQENGKWIEFDDDNPIPQQVEDIVKLSGGGDWHMAYICVYKSRTVSM